MPPRATRWSSLVLVLAAAVGGDGAASTGRDPGNGPAFPETSGRTYLAVVAHPDDENMMGATLASLARQGNRVFVIIATDGKYHSILADVPPGEGLGALRRAESECACEALGIEPPIFLSIDRLDTRNGVRPYLDGRKQLLASLDRHLTRIDPDVLFTFGPDGEYGHPEHIVIGAAVTELLLRTGRADEYPLYYFAWTRRDVADDDEIGYVDDRYLDLAVKHTDQDERRSFEAAECYRSQFTVEQVQELVSRESAKGANTSYFRRLLVGSGLETAPGAVEGGPPATREARNGETRRMQAFALTTQSRYPSVGLREYTLITDDLERDRAEAEAVLQAKMELPRAMHTKEREHFEQALGRDFTLHAKDEFFSREGYIRNRVEDPSHVRRADYRNVTVQLIGDLALVTYSNVVEDEPGGRGAWKADMTWADILSKEEGRWKYVAVHQIEFTDLTDPSADPGGELAFFAGRWTIEGSEETYLETCEWLPQSSYLACRAEDTSEEPPGGLSQPLGLLARRGGLYPYRLR